MMLSVTPIRDRARLESLFAGSELKMPPFGFGMDLQAGEDRGYALFEIDHAGAAIGILYAVAGDPTLVDAVLRAGIAAGEQMGCRYVTLSPGCPPDMAARLADLGYTQKMGLIDDFFGQCPHSK